MQLFKYLLEHKNTKKKLLTINKIANSNSITESNNKVRKRKRIR